MNIRKVMLVDDDPDVRTVTELSLRRIAEWEVVAVASGEDALARAGSEQPDVILLDTRMPGLDGLATLGRLRRDPATAAIPVIFLTARVQPKDIERYRGIGARGVIAKPFDAVALPGEIRRILVSGPDTGSAPVPWAEPDLDLDRLREGYKIRLERDLGALESDLEQARRDATARRQILENARALAHRLKGTSGSYGFTGTSAALARLEALLDPLLAAEAGASSDPWAEIDRALGDARRHVEIAGRRASASSGG